MDRALRVEGTAVAPHASPMEVDLEPSEEMTRKRASNLAQLLTPRVKKRKAAARPRQPGEAAAEAAGRSPHSVEVTGREAVERRVRFFHTAVAQAMGRLCLASRQARVRVVMAALTPLTSAVQWAKGEGSTCVGDGLDGDCGAEEWRERDRDIAALPGVVELAGLLQVSFFDASSVHRIALEVKALRRRGLDTCGVLDTLTGRLTGGILADGRQPTQTAESSGVCGKRVRDADLGSPHLPLDCS
eukprot:CAMPEP_0114618674 /NCGR_PEP_ID=MMETSP0168-20121206/7820_1 /TAXON_ID=95228 ORGANISM="Vannella sp., Strain DIVA3 517/6/12" /NCGR_SAMPLE_ID=MMETSP0168 /ASSEMBLY_ACC=CAM_ASM_000044 /LENGTH=243 /DNA_ID=CAMNT_0001829819 /DNA_START=42 /DNA_END=769 /DNA_ORIENTATION=+